MTSTATPVSQCSTGSVQCCNSLTTAGNSAAATILGLVSASKLTHLNAYSFSAILQLGIVVQDLNVIVGLTCSPLSVIGIGGSSCDAQTVCCENDSFSQYLRNRSCHYRLTFTTRRPDCYRLHPNQHQPLNIGGSREIIHSF